MRRKGSRVLPVTSTQALNGQRLIGGPLVICGWSFNDGTGTDSNTTSGTSAAPAAGATIASISLPNGLYTVGWNLQLSGTPGAADKDNVQLLVAATVIADSNNAGAAGEYPQQPAQAFVAFGPLTLAAKAIGAGVAGSVYDVTMTITPVNESLANINDGNMTIAQIGVPPASSQTIWLQDDGPRVETDLSVVLKLGTVSGAIWYYLDKDLDDYNHGRMA